MVSAGNQARLYVGETVTHQSEPPIPDPPIEEVLRMPQDTAEQLARRQMAALAWLRQYCARARFVLKVHDLHSAARTDCRFALPLAKIRGLVDEEQTRLVLAGTDSTAEGPWSV